MSTDSVWMLPVFWLTTVPLLWWRRSELGVTAVITAAMALHVLLFGWVTRCGCGLPLMLVLVYLGAVTYERRRAWLTLLAGAALAVATLVRDATTGPGALALALPLALLVFLLGRLVRERTATVRRLRDRNAELERLRDERADLEVALDRERLSVHLDRVVHGRLDQLAERAEDAAGADAAQTRAALMDLEAGGRALLEEMREILGLLRGPDTQFAPPPTVAGLGALPALRDRDDVRILVDGEPRTLPVTVELSAYRIVEHLVAVLARQPGTEVTLNFGEDELRVTVHGRTERTADIRGATERARERARLHRGSVDVRANRGILDASALLPVSG